ncbi:MAG TPA: hypothetical protein PKE20_00920 [Promineifilum sp.]|nr:hypothetical protein [Promineifilum sp.]
MGPLVYYCRWRGAKLRLYGRDEGAVWGQLAFPDDSDASNRSFRFDLQTWELILGEGSEQQRLQLDELGVVVSSDGRPAYDQL